MKPTIKLKDLIQQDINAIAQYSQLIGQGMMAVDCSEVESLTEEQLSQLFSGIPDTWDFVELAEVFDTDTFSDTLAQQFSEYCDRRQGRQPHPQTLSSEETGVKEQKALDIFKLRKVFLMLCRSLTISYKILNSKESEQFWFIL